MKKDKLIGIIMLLVCTILWGAAFSFQTMAKDYIQPFSLIGIRNIVSGLVMTPVFLTYLKVSKVKIHVKKVLISGSIIGIFLASASIVQQYGIGITTTGKAGFLTAMYIIFVPVISVFIFKKKLTIFQILGISITVVGVGLLSLNSDFSINLGDILCLVCALLFAGQIMSIDHFSKKEDVMALAIVQFYSCGIVSLIFSFFFEKTSFENIKNAILPILYLGIVSGGIAYTLQFLGQKKISGVPASLIMSLEAVFSAGFAAILLNEYLSTKEMIGAILMLVGVVIVQVFDKENKPEGE